MRSAPGSKSPYLPISEKGLSPWQKKRKGTEELEGISQGL